MHLALILSENYPVKPPKMEIIAGQHFDSFYHHHIQLDGKGVGKFCIDILDEAGMDSNANRSGWSPAYTFKTLMMQM